MECMVRHILFNCGGVEITVTNILCFLLLHIGLSLLESSAVRVFNAIRASYGSRHRRSIHTAETIREILFPKLGNIWEVVKIGLVTKAAVEDESPDDDDEQPDDDDQQLTYSLLGEHLNERRDVDTLIVDHYASRLTRQAAHIKSVARPRILPVQFSEMLMEGKQVSSVPALMQNRWRLEKPSLFMKMHLILLPVFFDQRWVLCGIYPYRKMCVFLDSRYDDEVVMETCFAQIKKWIRSGVGKQFVESTWTFVMQECVEEATGSDNGICLLTNMQCLFLGIDPLAYKATDMAFKREVVVCELAMHELEQKK